MTAAVTPSIIAGAPSFERSRAHARKVEGMLGSDEMIRKTHSELEEMLEGRAREWARLMLEEVLEWRAYVERKIAVEGVDNLPRRYARPSSRHVETVLGRVEVPRLSYQAPGALDLHPMDAALNLPREMYSHGVRRLVAREAAKSSFEEVVEPSRSSRAPRSANGRSKSSPSEPPRTSMPFTSNGPPHARRSTICWSSARMPKAS